MRDTLCAGNMVTGTSSLPRHGLRRTGHWHRAGGPRRGTGGSDDDCGLRVWLHLPPPPTHLTRWPAAPDQLVVRVYRLDMDAGNPAGLFDSMSGGEPKKHPYPTQEEFSQLREAAELPVRDCREDRIEGEAADDKDGCQLTRGSEGGWSVGVALPQPAVLLVHACYPTSAVDQGEELSAPAGLTLRTTTTPGQVFLRWEDVPSLALCAELPGQLLPNRQHHLCTSRCGEACRTASSRHSCTSRGGCQGLMMHKAVTKWRGRITGDGGVLTVQRRAFVATRAWPGRIRTYSGRWARPGSLAHRGGCASIRAAHVRRALFSPSCAASSRSR